MELLERIYNSLLLTESVSVDEVNDALDNHKRVIINYRSKIQKNIVKNQNLKNFMYLHYFEQLSILMFVYMNLVANMLQEELAGKVD